MTYPSIRRPLTLRRKIITAGFVMMGLGLGSAALAETAPPVQQHNSNAVWFENWRGLSNANMRITAPNGEITDVFAQSGTPVFRLEGRDILDGVYRYELSAATSETQKIVNPVDNGRGDAAKDEVAVSFNTGGAFVVQRGVIVVPEDVREE